VPLFGCAKQRRVAVDSPEMCICCPVQEELHNLDLPMPRGAK
jgi:hypothetical protein